MSRGCLSENLGGLDEIVGRGREDEDGLDFDFGADLELGQPGLNLDLAEGLLDALATALADLVADMARRAAIGCEASPAGSAGRRRGHGRRRPCRPERDPMPATATVKHRQRRLPLGRAGGMCERSMDDELVAVLPERVPHESQTSLPAH